MFGDAMVVIDTHQFKGRRYKCPCGTRVWSTFGHARRHSHECAQAWESGEVPKDHSYGGMVRERACCPECGKLVSYTTNSGRDTEERRVARHKQPSTGWCPVRRWSPYHRTVSGTLNGQFFFKRLDES